MRRIFSGISMVIGIFHILENVEKPIYPWHFGISLEYPLSQKNGKNSMYREFDGISREYPISQRNRNFLCTGNFLGYTLGYPISQKSEKFYVPDFFWDIPGISHIPKIWKILCTDFFLGYPIYQYFVKLCTAGA